MPVGSDGLPVREDGVWAREKLDYASRYMNIFATGMSKKWRRRVYVDLFSGPGRSIIEGTMVEIDGSPILALSARTPFTAAYLNDADPESIRALKQRIDRIEHAGTSVTIHENDCNTAALAVRSELLNAPSTIGLAFIDPTAFQIAFDSIKAMTVDLPVDLIITVMTGYLKRFIAQPSYERSLDRFFPTPNWRELIDLKEAGETLTFRRLLDSYENGLRSIGYRHVDDHVRILNSRASTIYHLVFASKHPRGADFFKKISQKSYSGQMAMRLDT